MQDAASIGMHAPIRVVDRLLQLSYGLLQLSERNDHHRAPNLEFSVFIGNSILALWVFSPESGVVEAGIGLSIKAVITKAH